MVYYLSTKLQILEEKIIDERERLINYCNNEKLEYTLCPRSIRVKERAVCIEVKRK